MRRNPRIINLYDKPLHPRLARARHDDASGLGTPLLLCAAIALATVGFFWGYDAIVHRDTLFLPSAAHADTTGPRPVRASEPLVPDMNAPEIVRANADVPASAFQRTSSSRSEHSPVASNAATPPKKRAPAAPQLSAEAREAQASATQARETYASAPTFFQPTPTGGW